MLCISIDTAQHVATRLQRAPIYLTLDELAAFDGSDESKPIYLAINGTIFDVSANPRIYGKGGTYNVFTGADASRGFVTGCFEQDRTADLRGVEDMFMPRDDDEVDRHWPAAELARMRESERDAALVKVDQALRHWTAFFDRNPRYHRVGFVKRDPGWLDKEPRKTLCPPAQDGRKPRVIPEEG